MWAFPSDRRYCGLIDEENLNATDRAHMYPLTGAETFESQSNFLQFSSIDFTNLGVLSELYETQNVSQLSTKFCKPNANGEVP
jgi:hypothetical protein